MAVFPLFDDRTVFWLKLQAIKAIIDGKYDDALKFIEKLKRNREMWEMLKKEIGSECGKNVQV